jgi:AraC family transcriptional regulator
LNWINLPAMTLLTSRLSTRVEYRRRMERVLAHIQRHLDESLDLASLARVAHFSPFHFHRGFRGMVGESVGEHVRRLRMERAALQLRQTDHSILQIALQAGYEPHEAFSRVFRIRFDCSPTHFRHAAHAPTHLPALCNVHYSPHDQIDLLPQTRGAHSMDVRIERIKPIRVAYVRGYGPYPQVFPKIWKKLNELAIGLKLEKPGAWRLSICNDDPELTPADKIRADACISCDESFQPTGDLQVREIPAGSYAVLRYQGPYSGLGNAWSQLCGHWLPQSGLKIRNAPCFEVYRNSPGDVPESELVTEIYEPVEA